MGRRRKINAKRKIDKKGSLFAITLLLFAVGIYTIFSATAPLSSRVFGNQYHFVIRHILSVLVGVVFLIISSNVQYSFWIKISKTLFLVTLLMLIAVFIPGIGINVLGASRWVNLGFLSIQPSEIAKFTVLIYFASLYKSKKDLSAYLFPLAVFALLIVLEPDMGTTVTVSLMSVILMFISGVDLKKMILLSLVMISLVSVFILASSYRRDRLLTYLGLEKDTLGKSYHINQILYALGSGGLLGVGMGESRQKYLYLPETATDSIFPIFAEEFGFVGASILILLIFLYIYKLMSIAVSSPDDFSRIIVSGLAVWVSLQTIFNIGSMVSLLPLTGIPLPFISYGGTAIVALSTATGIAINVEKHEK